MRTTVSVSIIIASVLFVFLVWHFLPIQAPVRPMAQNFVKQPVKGFTVPAEKAPADNTSPEATTLPGIKEEPLNESETEKALQESPAPETEPGTSFASEKEGSPEEEVVQKESLKDVHWITVGEEHIEVRFDMGKPVEHYKTFTLPSPSRLVVDFPGAYENPRVLTYTVDNALVSRIRLGTTEKRLRAVLDLHDDAILHTARETASGLMITLER